MHEVVQGNPLQSTVALLIELISFLLPDDLCHTNGIQKLCRNHFLLSHMVPSVLSCVFMESVSSDNFTPTLLTSSFEPLPRSRFCGATISRSSSLMHFSSCLHRHWSPTKYAHMRFCTCRNLNTTTVPK